MDNFTAAETLHDMELAQGFECAFDMLWGTITWNGLQQRSPFVTDEMQRWALLYPDEFKAACLRWDIDPALYQVEDITID